MEIKELCSPITILINIIGIVFTIVLFQDSRESLFVVLMGIIFVAFVILVAFVHSFWFKTIKNKLILSLADLASLLLLSILLGTKDGVRDFIYLFSFYVFSGVAIALLSYGLNFLWGRFRE